MRVLLIEDDTATSMSIQMMLGNERFNVYAVDNGEEGVDLCKLYEYDCIVLDETLPDTTAKSVVVNIRALKRAASIVALRNGEDVPGTVALLNAGADDCMPKPFHRDELVARIQATVRRYRGINTNYYEWGPLTVNVTKQTVTIDGEPIHLTVKEFTILEFLAARQGRVLSKEAILDHVYNGMDEPELKIIDVFICKLRKKLAEHGIMPIGTVWGRGYTINPYKPTEEVPGSRIEEPVAA